jgi:hypothetical protein
MFYKMKNPLLALFTATLLTGQMASAQSCTDVCPAIGVSSAFEWIQGLQLGPLTNISGDNGGYADFGDSFSATYTAGSTYSFTGVVGFPQGPFSETWVAWMDFNQDGDFDDAGEELFSIFGQTQVNGSFSIPANAVNGSIKLRVAMGFSVAQLCQNLGEGEIEDYCVNIVGGVPPPNPCDINVAVTGLSSVINSNNVKLTWDPVPNSVGCRVQGGLLGNFNVNKNVVGNEVGSLTVPLANLNPGTYNWRVTCACELPPNLTLTPFSDDAFFTIAAGIATIGSQSLSQEMSLSPNPTNGALNVMVTATANANEQIIITDLLGRTVLQENTSVIKGVNNVNLDVNSLSTGTYILILRDGNNMMTSMRFIKE